MTDKQVHPGSVTSAEKQSSPTAAITPDAIGLGSTQGQRSAEMVAALRAELLPSPEARALTKLSGRMAAGVIMRLAHNGTMMNFIAARPATFQFLIENNIPKNKDKFTIVEIAAGLSARGVHLARALPNVDYIEVDLPNVVKEKQLRFQRAGISLPPNISWRGADLGVVPLASLLNNQQVDMIVAEGLSQYFPPKEIQRIARNMQECLLPGGVYICDLSIDAFRLSALQVDNAVKFFSRHAGNFAGILPDEPAAQQLLLDAGYETVDSYRPSVVSEGLPQVPKPVIDFSAVFVARKKNG